MFLNYLENEPSLLNTRFKKIEMPEDKNPNLTKFIIRLFRDHMLTSSYKPDDKSMAKYIEGSNRATEWFKENRKHIPHFEISNAFMGEALWNSIVSDCKSDQMISPGWFCSDYTFNVRLPQYLMRVGAMRQVQVKPITRIGNLGADKAQLKVRRR
jgi:hypothetical protein